MSASEGSQKPNIFQSLFSAAAREENKQMPPQYKGASSAAELDVRFAENFTASGGKFVYCQNEEELVKLLYSLKEENKWNNIFSADFEIRNQLQEFGLSDQEGFFMDNSDAGITGNFALIADEGVILLSPDQATNRRLTAFPPNHIILASKYDLVKNLETALENFKEKYFEKLPSLIELGQERKICKANHARLLNAEGTPNVYVFYVDIQETDA